MDLHDGWTNVGSRWRKEAVFKGHGYCVCPGKPCQWANDFDRVLKSIAYESQRGIDWSCKPVAERAGPYVYRGVILEVEPWVYDMIMSIRSLSVRSVWTVS